MPTAVSLQLHRFRCFFQQMLCPPLLDRNSLPHSFEDSIRPECGRHPAPRGFLSYDILPDCASLSTPLTVSLQSKQFLQRFIVCGLPSSSKPTRIAHRTPNDAPSSCPGKTRSPASPQSIFRISAFFSLFRRGSSAAHETSVDNVPLQLTSTSSPSEGPTSVQELLGTRCRHPSDANSGSNRNPPLFGFDPSPLQLEGLSPQHAALPLHLRNHVVQDHHVPRERLFTFFGSSDSLNFCFLSMEARSTLLTFSIRVIASCCLFTSSFKSLLPSFPFLAASPSRAAFATSLPRHVSNTEPVISSFFPRVFCGRSDTEIFSRTEQVILQLCNHPRLPPPSRPPQLADPLVGQATSKFAVTASLLVEAALCFACSLALL